MLLCPPLFPAGSLGCGQLPAGCVTLGRSPHPGFSRSDSVSSGDGKGPDTFSVATCRCSPATLHRCDS